MQHSDVNSWNENEKIFLIRQPNGTFHFHLFILISQILFIPYIWDLLTDRKLKITAKWITKNGLTTSQTVSMTTYSSMKI